MAHEISTRRQRWRRIGHTAWFIFSQPGTWLQQFRVGPKWCAIIIVANLAMLGLLALLTSSWATAVIFVLTVVYVVASMNLMIMAMWAGRWLSRKLNWLLGFEYLDKPKISPTP